MKSNAPSRAQALARASNRPYRYALQRLGPLLTLLLLTTGLSGCAQRAEEAYPGRYLAALDTRSGTTVRDEHLERFVKFITHMGSDQWQQHFEGLYADELHFSDTLALINDRSTLRSYFKSMHEADTTVEVQVLSHQTNGRDAYLIWEMTSTFEPLFERKTSHTIGATHLRFNGEGQVILHQDFWDAAHGFYEHLPMLGGAVRSVRSRLQP